MNRYVGVSGLLVLMLSSADRHLPIAVVVDSRALTVTPVPTQDPLQRLRGLFLAVSDDRTAWLVYLDAGSKESALYDPLIPVPLCNVRVDSHDSVSIASAELDGTVLRFSGTVTPQGFAGTLQRLRARTGRVMDTLPLTFRKIDARFLAGRPDPLSGVYTNLRGTESGDVYGRELVLIEAANEFVALDVVYEGSPGRVHAALKAERTANTLHFLWALDTTQAIQHPADDTAIIRLSALDFKPGAAVIRGDTRPLPGYMMKKWLSVQQMFHRAPRSDCR